MNDTRQEDQSFESLLGQFDEIVTALEANDLSLEEAIEKYERAAELAALCAQLLNQAELRIRRIDEGLARLDETDEWDDTDEH
jgi:exodeoxyribonuclease VII small subunit